MAKSGRVYSHIDSITVLQTLKLPAQKQSLLRFAGVFTDKMQLQLIETPLANVLLLSHLMKGRQCLNAKLQAAIRKLQAGGAIRRQTSAKLTFTVSFTAPDHEGQHCLAACLGNASGLWAFTRHALYGETHIAVAPCIAPPSALKPKSFYGRYWMMQAARGSDRGN